MIAALEALPGHGRRIQGHASGQANRNALLAAITREPGLTFRGVCRAAGIATGTARHHLSGLRGAGQVVCFTRALEHLYYPAGWTGATAARHALLAEAGFRELLDCLRDKPRCQREVADALPWPRSTTQNRLKRLTQAGALRFVPRGRYLIYEVAS